MENPLETLEKYIEVLEKFKTQVAHNRRLLVSENESGREDENIKRIDEATIRADHKIKQYNQAINILKENLHIFNV